MDDLVSDNRRLVEEFGASPISKLKELPDFYTFNQGLIYSHRDFDVFMKVLKQKKRLAIVSGFNASGSLHIGHKAVFETNLFFQKKYGLDVFIPISDDESYVAGKVETQEEGLENAMRIAKQLLAFGFDPKKTFFIIDQVFTDIYNLAIKLSRGTTMSTLKATYGYSMESNPGLYFYPCVQAAHILLPLEKDFGSHFMTLVPIGPDEDSHIRISRDLASKFGYRKPAILHSMFLPALDGRKMSKSNPDTAIFYSDSSADVKRKIYNAFTGGQETKELQLTKGGNPSVCVVYRYLDMFYYLPKERFTVCKKLCGDCKNQLVDFVVRDLEEFNKRLKKVSPEKCILKNK